jgi:hypothetical protein
MKKLTYILLIAALLAGCGKAEEEEPKITDEFPEIIYSINTLQYPFLYTNYVTANFLEEINRYNEREVFKLKLIFYPETKDSIIPAERAGQNDKKITYTYNRGEIQLKYLEYRCYEDSINYKIRGDNLVYLQSYYAYNDTNFKLWGHLSGSSSNGMGTDEFKGEHKLFGDKPKYILIKSNLNDTLIINNIVFISTNY